MELTNTSYRIYITPAQAPMIVRWPNCRSEVPRSTAAFDRVALMLREYPCETRVLVCVLLSVHISQMREILQLPLNTGEFLQVRDFQ